jgi:hypothetical protein
MNTHLANRVVLIGLPEAGKTSFLAALWYLVQHSQASSRLRLDTLDGDSTYLNRIAAAWAGYELVPRTQIDSEKIVSMLLKDVKTGSPLTVIFPDLSGESFNLQWTTRQFTRSYDEFLKGATGGILFVTPLKYRKPIRIDAATPLVEIILEGMEKEEPVQDTSAPQKPWNPERVPTQVELVELLQFISSREGFGAPFRLAVVVSAWDQLLSLGQPPADWLAKEFPMLHQFLESNRDKFETAVYGVSAQGADYRQTEDIVDKNPSDRIQVIGHNISNPHDITEPMLWLST